MARLRTVGDLIDRLEPHLMTATEAQMEHVARASARQEWGLALAVLRMRAALAAEQEPKKGSDSGGDDEMSNQTMRGSDAVMGTIRTVARHIKRPGESDDEAFLRACSEQPTLTRQFDDARRHEAARGVPPVRPTKAKADALEPLVAEQRALEGEILRAAEAHGMDEIAFVTEHPEGRALYATYDQMVKRKMRRAEAERLVGRGTSE